jgi:drug/metabolite transporter (DMT)-like permease
LLTIVALLWAGNSIVGRAARDLVPPVMLAWTRWAGALAILLPFAWPYLKADRAVLLRHWKAVVLLGLLGIASFNTLLYLALQQTTATNSLLIQSGTPAMILVLGAMMFRDPVDARTAGAVALSIVGVGVIVARGSLAELAAFRIQPGDGLMLLATLIWALYSVLLRWRPAVHPLSFLAATFAVGLVAVTPFMLAEHAGGARIIWGWGGAGAIAYVAILPSLIAYLLYNRGVELIGPGAAGQFITLTPLFGAGLALLLLGEPLRPYHFAGLLLIVAGIAATAWLSRAAAPPPARDR